MQWQFWVAKPAWPSALISAAGEQDNSKKRGKRKKKKMKVGYLPGGCWVGKGLLAMTRAPHQAHRSHQRLGLIRCKPASTSPLPTMLGFIFLP